MEKFSKLSRAERRDVLQEAANIKGINVAVVEKDFWVCWVLGKIFSSKELKDHIVFKGGTSLSKAFGLIGRFSEDIDLVLDWRVLGYTEHLESEVSSLSSRTKQDRFNKDVNARAAAYISSTLLEILNDLFEDVEEMHCAVNANDAQTINVVYPATFSEDYLRPEIWLEIGPLASFTPSVVKPITPYAGEALPDFFGPCSVDVVAITPERTFWEKATILHQQAHRVGIMPARYSRHYYDLYKLSSSSMRKHAVSDHDLLRDVVTFKDRFYPCAWARYDLARPGTLKLLPSEQHVKELDRDYDGMAVMLFEDGPRFDDILVAIRKLEHDINAIGS